MMLSDFVAEGYSLRAKPVGKDTVQVVVVNHKSGEFYMLLWNFVKDSTQLAAKMPEVSKQVDEEKIILEEPEKGDPSDD